MFEWKNLELSPEDYQNYINNEDQAQTKINNCNITEPEWSQMYRQIQLKSLDNKKIKKFVLSYESYMKNLLSKIQGGLGAKELHAFYFKLSNQLKMHFTQIYGQIGLMHIRNLSTTVQFSFSRLLNLEEQLIKVIGNLKNEIDELKTENDKLILQKSSHLCSSCYEQMEKNRNKFYNRQIFAIQQPSLQLEKEQQIELSQVEKIEKQEKEETKKQQHEYQMDRFYYLNSVEQILRNRQKILKCNSAPLQTLLQQYLTQILEMLQGSKFSFTQKNLREYDRVNKSYESLDDMKSLINAGEFYSKVSMLLQKPYQNFVGNIQKHINKSGKINTAKKITVQTQTLYMQQYDQIKNLQRRMVEFNFQIQNLRQSKSKTEIDLINNIEALRKIQARYTQTYNRNKLLEMENKKLQKDIIQFKKTFIRLQEDYKENQNKLIDNNVIQKSNLIKENKILQAIVNQFQSLKKEGKTDQKQVQTDMIQIAEAYYDQAQHKTEREHKKLMIERRNQKRDYKRVSIKPQDIKIINQLSINKHYQQKLGVIPSSRNLKIRQNQHIPFLQMPKVQRSSTQKKTIKVYTLSPLDALNDKVIHKNSSRKISKKDENTIPELPLSFRTPDSTPISNSNRIKKISGIKRKHGYHNSQISKKPNLLQNTQKENRISLIKGKKIIRQNSMEQNLMKASINNLIYSLDQNYNHIPFNPYNSILEQVKERQLLSAHNQSYIVEVNRKERTPTNHAVNNQISLLLSRLNPETKYQLQRLIKFSIKNYDMLIEKNILGMLYDMTAKDKRVSRKISQINQINIMSQKNQENDPVVDIQCCKIGKKCLQIFFNIEEAQKYQKKQGIWENFDSFIMVDNNFTSICEKIALFFYDMKVKRPMLYQQSILFLQKPYYFCQEVEGQDYETKQITIFKESLKLFEIQRDWIKNLFKKLLRLHKLMHKNCRHIEKFLDILGFK